MNMNPTQLFNRPVSPGGTDTSATQGSQHRPGKSTADNMLQDVKPFPRTENGNLTIAAIREITDNYPATTLRSAESIKSDIRQGITHQMFQDPHPDYDSRENQLKLANELEGEYECYTPVDINVLTGEARVEQHPALRDDVVISRYTPEQLTNEYPTHSRIRQPLHTEDATAARLPGMPSGISMTTLGSLSTASTGTDNIVGTQTDTAKNSTVNRYGALVASSLSAILGAVLMIAAKTHAHDEIDVEGANDLQPEEPDYDAIGKQAAESAEQAFVEKWQDPDMWGPGKVGPDGSNKDTGEPNKYYQLARDPNSGEFYFSDRLTPEGERTLSEVKETAVRTAVEQAQTDYEKALEEASQHNKEHTSGTLSDGQNGKDHNAMLGIGATLLSLGSLATTLIAGNKLTHRSHDRQQAQGITPEHGSVKNFVEQKLFRVKA